MKFYFFALYIFFVPFLNGQSTSRIETILKLKRTQVPKIETGSETTVLYLPCPFSESNFASGSSTKNILDLTVVKVYYVYTQYKQNSSFNQLELDRKRFAWLNSTYPTLLTDPLIEWEIIEQTGCTDATTGDAYFHGFIVVHRPVPGPESRQEELKRIDAYLLNPTDVFPELIIDPVLSQLPETKTGSSGTENKVEKKNTKAEYFAGEFALYDHLKDNLKNSDSITPQRIDKWVKVSFEVDTDGKIDSLQFLEEYPEAARDQVTNAFKTMPDWKPATESGKSISSTVNMEIRVSYSGEVKGMYTRDGIKPNFSEMQNTNTAVVEETGINLLVKTEPITVKSSAVYKGLDLFKLSKNTAVVMDVTGSMTSHIAALLNWVRTNKLNANFTSYTFFNDGDAKTTKQKKIGETGGIYLVKNIAEIDKTIKDAMVKGNGGEAPENDLEAVIYAFQNDPLANEVILIGDNFSEVRDIELLKNINRPVHVLLCAAPKFVRCEYLKIAKDTGGFVLLNGEKLDLSAVQKGDIIQIQKVDYKYNGSEFSIDYDGDIIY